MIPFFLRRASNLSRLISIHHPRNYSSYKSPYEILGLDKNATSPEIKKAYFALAKKYHPDTNKDPEASKRFLEIQNAYEILSDPKKKESFDTNGFDHTGDFGNGYGRSPHGSSFDTGEVFRNIFGRFSRGSPFSDLFRNSAEANSISLDAEAQISLTFMEACLGVRKSVSYHIQEDCSDCGGSGTKKGTKMQACGDCHGSGHTVRSKGGMIFYSDCGKCSGSGQINPNPCSTCNGKGLAYINKTIDVNIPAGVVDDQMMVVSGAGNRVRSKHGDLYISFKIGRSILFERRRQDIYSSVTVDFITAILGGEIDVQTIHGSVRMKIPPGSQPDDTKRITGKGIIDAQTGARGNHYVRIIVQMPKELSDKQKEYLAGFKNIKC